MQSKLKFCCSGNSDPLNPDSRKPHYARVEVRLHKYAEQRGDIIPHKGVCKHTYPQPTFLLLLDSASFRHPCFVFQKSTVSGVNSEAP